MHAILEYAYADDYLTSRQAHRTAHLRAAWAAADRGELVLGGAVGEGPDSGLLIFRGDDPLSAAAAFAAVDPYVLNGVVTGWTVRRWTTVVGEAAAEPFRP
ncbi:YciI-like protein [Microbacterium sp. NPDC055903]